MGHAAGVLLAEKLLSSLEDNEMPLLRLQSLKKREWFGKYVYMQPSFMSVLSRRVFRCLLKTYLNLLLVCIYGLNCLLPNVKTMKEFNESLACRPLNF